MGGQATKSFLDEEVCLTDKLLKTHHGTRSACEMVFYGWCATKYIILINI